MDGYEVDTGALGVQANKDWTDAAELDGCARELWPLEASAATGAGADQPGLQEALDQALSLFRNVFYELSDAATILGSSTQASAANYAANESVSAATYARMGAI